MQCVVFFVFQRLFVVPANPSQKLIPYARVNHNKYMVTDKIAYIGKATPCMWTTINNT